MNSGKDQSRLTLHQTPGRHQEENHVPETIGTWSLRNREQLRKRRYEAQEKQTSQWQFGEKKCKKPRTGKGNKRGRKRQQNTDLKAEPQSQFKKDTGEKALAPTEKETEPPRTITEALSLVASPKKDVPEKQFSAMDQETIVHQENSSELQETATQNHPSETCQDMADPEVLSPKMCQETAILQGHPSRVCPDMTKPEDLSPKMCQEIAVLQDHPFRMCPDMAEPEALSSKMCQETAILQSHSSRMGPDMTKPEDFSPKMCQEIAVLQGHPFRMCPDMTEPEDLSPKMCQETAVAKVLPSKTEDRADLEGCSPEAFPTPDVPKGYAHETHQKRAESEEHNSEPDQGMGEIESFLPKTEEIAVPKDPSIKTHQETVEPERFSHETYKEIAVPKAPCHETIQEIPADEEYSPEIYQETPEPEDYASEIYQETPGPEDLSTNTYKNKDVTKECFPEPYQGTGGAQGENPKGHQEDAEDVYAFPQEMRDKPKAEEPEMPAIPNIPQEIHPENDVYSYVLF
ncbi:hemogen [Hyaena hyaena]|uniref:hemogen n=1 Tax=Hyaena hyaena TaxID=95912 RepID=UPI0019221623|nr:hemogen [Hyaena hyaena]